MTRLSEIGKPPDMTPTANPTADPKYRPVTMPMPNRQESPAEANSLWRPGSRAFFKDQRASQIGDIITVIVNTSDSANLKDETSQGRTSSEAMGVPNI
jgi:flagellar L-ring protein precursor FlgH